MKTITINEDIRIPREFPTFMDLVQYIHQYPLLQEVANGNVPHDVMQAYNQSFAEDLHEYTK